MKRKIRESIAIALAIIASLSTYSCQNENDNLLDVECSKNQQYEYVSVGNLDISLTSSTRSTDVKNYSVNINNDNGQSMLHFNLLNLENSHMYGCDMNEDEIPDFYVEFTSSDKMDHFFYLDKGKNIIQECSLIKNSANEFTIDVLHIYNSQEYNPITRGESWEDCFTRRMGSALGITMEVAAGFLGPEGSAAIAVAGALSCAIYDPF